MNLHEYIHIPSIIIITQDFGWVLISFEITSASWPLGEIPGCFNLKAYFQVSWMVEGSFNDN